MDKQIIIKEQKRKKRKRICRKIFFMICAVMVLVLWIFNNHSASKGVPGWLINGITKPLKNAGYHLHAKQYIYSFTEGLFIKNLDYREEHSGIRVEAPFVFIDIQPLAIFKGIFLPLNLVVKNGTADIPILPESGEEGKMDHLKIRNLNVEIQGKKGLLEVEKISAEIGKINVLMKGTVNNFLHIMIENIFTDFWEQNKAGKQWKNRKYPYGIIQMFPLEIRKKFMLSYHRFDLLKMKRKTECNVDFHIDLNDFKNCNIDADIILPEFQFKDMKFLEIRERISLKKGVLELEEVSLDLGNQSALTASGTYYDEGEVLSGKVNGKCRIADLIRFIEPDLAKEIQKHIVAEDELISFKGTLDHFSVSRNRYKGNIELTIPQIIADGIPLKKVQLLVHADEKQLKGDIRHAEVDGGNITGTFLIKDSGEILCTLHGKAKLSTFRETFPDEIKKFFKNTVSFKEKEPAVSFTGTFRSDSRQMKRYSGKVSVQYPHIRINGVEIQNIIADLEFSPELIHISKLSANTADNSRFSGIVKIDLPNKNISAKLIAAGIPGNLAKAFDTVWQTDSLTSLAKDISSPDKKGIVETDVELFAAYGKKSFYRISGNVVMRNPTYCGIPFQYGAARFITDSDDRLIIPDLILKAKDGTMQLESIYYEKDSNNEETLHFNLKSNIKGNDLLTIFCEDYDPVLVDFPFPINVNAKGVINYTNQKKTAIQSNVQNGSCTFAGAKLVNIDAVLYMKNEEISFKNAEMNFCKGVCKADFNYNFETGKGSFDQTLDGADLREVLRQFGATEYIPAGTGNGKLAFSSKGTFEEKGKDGIMINGSGKLDLNGDDLWNIPIMKDFLKYITGAWSMLGNSPGITRISCNILFDKDKAVIKDVKANGNFVSMDAEGQFLWNTGEYDVTVFAELLKSALPFEMASQILKPISWMLKKNFKGTYTPPTGKQ